ncbi:cytochrome P450 [Actinomadura fulvescens]|uniref:Cytochrome P450 n=1 Tax=Actinomadura fulvescens TaxID=46160 RepID=A0ABN3PFI9_9ACTN
MALTEQPESSICPHFPFPRQDVPAEGVPWGPDHDPLGLAPHYEELGLVTRVSLSDGQEAHLVTGHAECVEVLRDETRFVRGATPGWPAPDGIRPYPTTAPTLLCMDGKQHRLIRGLAGNAFATATIHRYRPMVQTLTTRLVEDMLNTSQPVEVNQALGMPLTLGIIGAVMGVPEQDLPQFAVWGDLFLSTGPDRDDDNSRAKQEMAAYMGQAIGQRMASLDSAPPDELMTSIAARAAAHIADNPGQAEQTMTDTVIFAASLVIAGWETTAAAIASFLFRLLTHHGHDGTTLYRQLCTHPERIPTAVEELMRTIPNAAFESAQPRRAIVDTELAGVPIKAGDLVIAAIDRANRDPRTFNDPDQLDFTRAAASQHLGFGGGPHICMGAPLARLELNVVLETLTQRAPNLRLHTPPQDVQWNTATTIRRPAELWIQLR